MKKELQNKLIQIAEKRQAKDDASHDFQHVMRVFHMAVKMGKQEGADLDVLIPAALFHDIIIYPKDHPKSKNETDESAAAARRILEVLKEYPQEKIELVALCIRECSTSKGIMPKHIESKILQDADHLEATGALLVMRIFSSGGQMRRAFYNPEDPFCKKDGDVLRSNMDSLYRKYLFIEKRLHTSCAKKIAKRRNLFLKKFLKEFSVELKETGIV